MIDVTNFIAFCKGPENVALEISYIIDAMNFVSLCSLRLTDSTIVMLLAHQ